MTRAVEGTAPPVPPPHPPTAHALRVALAATACLVVVELGRLQHGNLAVWTTHMVMSQYSFSIFQKGVERIVGRGLGILAGLVLATLFLDAPGLSLFVEAILLLGFAYVYFAGRLAYTFLNAGLYLAAIVEIAHAEPESVWSSARTMFIAIVVGVVIADLVSWFTGAERDLHIQPGGEPLLPVRGVWLSRALMLVVTTLLTQLAARWLGLPAEQALVSVLLLTVTPGIHELLEKSGLRIAGALAGAAWATGSFFFLNWVPHFLLLLVLLFFGMFVASYLTRTGGSHSYFGLQMGLVLPLVLVVPAQEFGDLTSARLRLEGVAAALVCSVLVGVFWPRFSDVPAGGAGKASAAS
jgi:uncharacterized membrane protein YccC